MNDALESTWNEAVVVCSTYCSDVCLERAKRSTNYIIKHVPSKSPDVLLCHCCYGQFFEFRERCSVVHYVGLFSAVISTLYCRQSVSVAARSKVCGRSPAETVGSNPTGGMDVCLL